MDCNPLPPLLYANYKTMYVFPLFYMMLMNPADFLSEPKIYIYLGGD